MQSPGCLFSLLLMLLEQSPTKTKLFLEENCFHMDSKPENAPIQFVWELKTKTKTKKQQRAVYSLKLSGEAAAAR